MTTWTLQTLGYLFLFLLLFPLSVNKLKLTDILLILGAGYLLVTGFLTLEPNTWWIRSTVAQLINL